MPADNLLGEYLQARRKLVRPADVGVADSGRRRVPGLRREELALLAGISADYYVRLEQGSNRHPSEQVLDALGHALGLADDAIAHLYRLARPAPRRRIARRPERVSPHLHPLLEAWAETPAYVLGRCWDVLAANALARALHPEYRRGVNLLRTIFLDPDAREFYLNWDRLAQGCVAALRDSSAADLDDPRLTDLVGELSLHSDAFRRLWGRHDVRAKTHLTKRLNHPVVGELELNFVSLSINGAPGQQLVVYHAEPHTTSAQALTLLSTLTSGTPTDVKASNSPPDQSPAEKDSAAQQTG